MAKASPMITSFNAGEFSPLMGGRADLKYWTSACRRMRNFIPTRQGPARRRPGTRFVAAVKDSAARTWLWKFEFNTTQVYILEFGNLYIRFFSNHGVVGAPYEVVTPYTTADLINADGTFALRFVQSNDVLYIVHRNYAPRKLVRTGAATFTLSVLSNTGGPFKDVDPDNAVTVYAGANTGAGVTFTASAGIFTADYIGALLLLEQKDILSIAHWEPAKVIALGNVRRSNGKNYTALNAATTGQAQPNHSRGAVYDGNTGVQWQYDDPGNGYAKITAVAAGGLTCTADILSRIPDNAVGVGNATTHWAFGAWNELDKYPDAVTFFRERLAFTRSRKGWMSVAGDFENFSPKDEHGLVTADMAISFDITSDRSNDIQWIAPSDEAMLIGSAGDEHALFEITSTEPFGPGNAQARKQSEYGSRHVPIVRVGDGVVYAQKSGRKIRDMRLAESVNARWMSTDLTVLAEHVTRGGVLDMAYQQEPDSIIWAARADGQLLGMTLDREQDVRGWHPHRIGGYSDALGKEYAAVESIVAAPAPEGDRDELWMIVNRYVNGASKRYVEWMEYVHEDGYDPQDAFYVDSGLTLNNSLNATLTPGAGATVKGTVGVAMTAGAAVLAAGDVGRYIHYRWYESNIKGEVVWHLGVALITAVDGTGTIATCTIRAPWPDLDVIPTLGWRKTTTTITGLGHLEGQTVQVCADGSAHPDRVVVGGAITLQEGASKAHVGLACSAVLQPMPIEAGAADGVAQGKTKRISRVIIRFHQTLGAKYGRDEDAQMDRILTRAPGDSMDEPPPLFTGDRVVSWPDGYSGDGLITIVQDQPLPCTVVALMPQVNTQDNR